MNDRLLNWIKPQIDFDWTEYWNEKDRFSSFDQGPLAVSYYQSDQKRLLTGLFDELIDELPESGRVLDVGCGNGDPPSIVRGDCPDQIEPRWRKRMPQKFKHLREHRSASL